MKEHWRIAMGKKNQGIYGKEVKMKDYNQSHDTLEVFQRPLHSLRHHIMISVGAHVWRTVL